MIAVVTATNARYVPRILPYLDSLQTYSQLPVKLVCVSCVLPPEHAARLTNVEPVRLYREANAGAPSETESPQHGGFLQALPGSPYDVLIFTDGDILLQRPFSDNELDWLTTFPADTVAAGWNSGPDETLAVEAQRLFPKVSMGELALRFGEVIYDTPCYNIGVFVARRATYERIYQAYMRLWPLACDSLGHAARQQWLVCYVLRREGIQVQVPGYGWHANGHYGTPPGVLFEQGYVTYEGEPVLFRHKL